MPLDAARTTTQAITEAFDAIGRDAPTSMPRSKRKLDPVAFEYHASSQLSRLAEARKRKAEAAAVKAGVLFDPSIEPRPIGTVELVYAGDVVEIGVSVGTPGTRLDVQGVIRDLEKAGLKLPKINAIINGNTIENRAPHKFTSSLTNE